MIRGLEVDEAALLKAYHLDTLRPTTWNEADHSETTSGRPAVTANLNDEPDPLGLSGILPMSKAVDKDMLPQVHLSSKTFDPKTFLSTIHPDATFADLTRGNNHLKHAIEQRSEALRILVESNFDKFVAVKATTEGVYREMKETKEGPLKEENDYGVKELKMILAQASAKADQVFMPVLENNLKAIKLRSTLGVFERSRFFFNLPGSLTEAVEAGRYEQALRDYKKGKYLLESRPGQLLAFSTNTNQTNADVKTMGSTKHQAQQQRVFAKVWDAVEATMEGMKDKLLDLLRQPKRGVEEQEKTIEILLELRPEEDPVGLFLQVQHDHIQELMNNAYRSGISKVEAATTVSKLVMKSDDDRARDLQDCIRQLSRSEQEYDRMIGAPVWKAIHDLVHLLSDVIVQTLPSFWRVCKNLAEGKLKSKRLGAQSQAKAWATQSVQIYIKYLNEFFSLEDVSVMARQTEAKLSPFVPSHSSSMTAASFMKSILTEVTETINDLKGLKIENTPSSLDNTLVNIRFRFTDVLCQLWIEDAKIIHRLEDWTLNPEEEATTLFLGELTAFHKSNTRIAYRLASGKDAERSAIDNSSGTSSSTKSKEVMPKYADFSSRVKTTFLDAIYIYLDGLVHLAFSEYNPLHVQTITSTKLIPESNRTTGSIIDVKDLDTRILLGVTNLSHLARSIAPLLAKQLQDIFSIKLGEDLQTIDEVATELDKILFTDYIERRGAFISKIFQEGITSSGIDWNGLPKPSEVHPYIYEALLSLVQTHAQVRTVAKPLVPRTITTLLENLAEVILESFKQIPRFGMGGMLQATLEIEFTHQTLAQYVSTKAEKLLKEIYQTISQKYVRSNGSRGNQEDVMLQGELENVKKILLQSRKSTALEFLCFRKTKEVVGGSNSGEKERQDVRR